MKIVLRQDVENLGERGQVVNVATGYARNYLLPKKLALEATPGNLKTLDLHKKVWAQREVREVADAQSVATKLAGVEVTVTKKAGENDTLYGSVTTGEIADLLARSGFEVDRRKIQIDQPIKTLGTYTVHVKIHRQVTAPVTVQVVAESD
jgi:large subunit ribosomal protein L9